MARCAVPARVVAGGTNIRATLAFEGVGPLHAPRTSQRDVPTTQTRTNLAAHAREISDLGKELYKRIADMSGHFSDVGSKLGKAVESYNKAVGSLESRVLVSARKFRDLETTGTEQEIDPVLPVETARRELQASEMVLKLLSAQIR